MDFESHESSSIRREQNEPYELANDMITDAFDDDDVAPGAMHQWFNSYFDNVVGQEVHTTNERLRTILFRSLTLDELLSTKDVRLWFETSQMMRPKGLPTVQFSKIDVSFWLNEDQQAELERLKSYQQFVVDEKAYQQQLMALYQEVSFAVDYEFFSVHETYEQLPTDETAEQYYDFDSGYCIKSSHDDDGDFAELDLLKKPDLLLQDDYEMSESDILEVKDEIVGALTAALHAGAVADAIESVPRRAQPHLLEAVELIGENKYELKDAAQ